MSDTNTRGGQDAPALPRLPGFSVRPGRLNVAGHDRFVLDVAYGEPPAAHTMQVMMLDLADQFDLLEIVGAANEAYQNMAMAAAAVNYYDGVPLPGYRDKHDLRERLRQIGTDGLRAVVEALNSDVAAAAAQVRPTVQGAAKN